jgi:hypothetical protein
MESHSEGNDLVAGVFPGFGTSSSKKTKHDPKAVLDLKIGRCIKKDFALNGFLLFLIFIYSKYIQRFKSTMDNIFTLPVTNTLVSRINQLKPSTQPSWGKMSVDQMLAHCCVPYEMVFTEIHSRPHPLFRFMLKLFVKQGVVNEKPYPKNSRTAPAFIITGSKDFEQEKTRLIAFVQQTHALGASYFEGKESLSFGPLTSQEWNNLFYKHLDHHLTQFGV